MEMRTIGRYLVALSIVGVLLIAGCTSQLPSGNNQTTAEAYPRSPLEIVSPIHYQGIPVNGSETTIARFTLNLTVIPDTTASDISEQSRDIDITTLFITYTDSHDIYILEPGDYSITRWHNGDGDDALELGEVVELTLPLQQPISANTDVYVEFWVPYRGTLTLAFRTPDTIESSRRVVEFTATPFVPD